MIGLLTLMMYNSFYDFELKIINLIDKLVPMTTFVNNVVNGTVPRIKLLCKYT